MRKLTPTSYAILGLLARRPWSAYELNNHMKESVLRAFWSRAESHVYSEPKKLEGLGLVTSHTEDNGGRTRTIYTVNEEGRAALQEWLAAPTETYFTMQYEAMLKFLYAGSGDMETLRNNLAAVKDTAVKEAAAYAAIIGDFEDETIRTMPGAPYNGIALEYLVDVMEARIHWAESTQALLTAMPDTNGDSRQAQTLGHEAYQRVLQRLENLLGQVDSRENKN
ncbi:PadR family transcriptional regulator [Oceanicoccus sp. KOV_DT_Chl]|uniref:PadR family transcriptional regulator n=1 Tax=Oceanicoccus sp. KOV_DT_Chl TaxID=1904639 RepID=UPI000C7A89FA|nr:PadR family transcriptional regulator [Oceanicoccus sp. KOV_DT_Chl]